MKYFINICVLIIPAFSHSTFDERFKNCHEILSILQYFAIRLHSQYNEFSEELDINIRNLCAVRFTPYENLDPNGQKIYSRGVDFVNKYKLIENENTYKKPIERFLKENSVKSALSITIDDIKPYMQDN